MWPRLVKQDFALVRVDPASAVLIPLTAIILVLLVGHLLISIGAVKSVYSSPFVALCAVVSNRVCIRAGMLTAILSVVCHEFFFAAPYWMLNAPTPEQAVAYGANFLAAWLVARRVPVPPKPRAPSDTRPLPFVGPASRDQKSFWVVEGGRDWIKDCAVGAEYGRIYLDHMAERSPCPALAWIVRDMVRARQWTGVEAGFMSAVERAAARGMPASVSVGRVSDRHADDLDRYRAVV